MWEWEKVGEPAQVGFRFEVIKDQRLLKLPAVGALENWAT